MTSLRKAALIIAAAALSSITFQSASATSHGPAIRHANYAVLATGVIGCCPGQ
jgi:hypothetical protein